MIAAASNVLEETLYVAYTDNFWLSPQTWVLSPSHEVAHALSSMRRVDEVMLLPQKHCEPDCVPAMAYPPA